MREIKTVNCKDCDQELQTKGLNPQKWVCTTCRDKKHKIDMTRRNKEYWKNNQDKIQKYNLKHKEQRASYSKIYNKKYYQENKESIKIQTNDWYYKNRDHILNWNREYQKTHPVKETTKERKHISNKLWRNKNNLLLKKYGKLYNKNNRDKINQNKKERRMLDVEYKLLETCRNRLNHAINTSGNRKSQCTIKLIGCTTSKLKEHLEKLFLNGMNWDNHGYGYDKWHIDHIIPCDSFDFSDPIQQKKCFHYTNLQPLWQVENLRKSNKIV